MARNSLALLLIALSAAASAQDLGTLFLTPKERNALDRLRRGEPIVPVERTEKARPDPVVTGYVKRSDGKSTVFIDRKPYPVRDDGLQNKLTPQAVEAYVPPPVTEAPQNPSWLAAPANGTQPQVADKATPSPAVPAPVGPSSNPVTK